MLILVRLVLFRWGYSVQGITPVKRRHGWSTPRRTSNWALSIHRCPGRPYVANQLFGGSGLAAPSVQSTGRGREVNIGGSHNPEEANITRCAARTKGAVPVPPRYNRDIPTGVPSGLAGQNRQFPFKAGSGNAPTPYRRTRPIKRGTVANVQAIGSGPGVASIICDCGIRDPRASWGVRHVRRRAWLREIKTVVVDKASLPCEIVPGLCGESRRRAGRTETGRHEGSEALIPTRAKKSSKSPFRQGLPRAGESRIRRIPRIREAAMTVRPRVGFQVRREKHPRSRGVRPVSSESELTVAAANPDAECPRGFPIVLSGRHGGVEAATFRFVKTPSRDLRNRRKQ